MFAVIYVPYFSLQAVLRQDPDLASRPVALIDPADPKRGVFQFTQAARLRGVTEALTASQAVARCADLTIRFRSPVQEQAATGILLQTAYAFSPRIEATGLGICTLELKGLGLDKDSAHAWGLRLLETLARCHLTARLGFGPSPELAWLAARQADPILRVRTPGAAPAPAPTHGSPPPRVPEANVESFPLEALQLAPELLALLKRWGIHSVGALLALDPNALAERLGPALPEIFERISARSIRPLKPVVPPATFEEQIEFEREIETVEPLLFVLRRFVEQLSRRLDLVYLAAGEFQLRLKLSSGADYERVFKIPAPTAKTGLLFRMLQTHLETVRTDAPIVSLSLRAIPAAPEKHQFGLFETTLRDPNRFAETLARLTALFGDDRVGTPCLEPTHRPDAFRMKKPEFEAKEETESPPKTRGASLRQRTRSNTDAPGTALFPEKEKKTALSASPPPEPTGLQLRRFRPALRIGIEFHHRRPARIRSPLINSPIAGLRGPFLSSGDWWDRQSWSRQEWDVQVADGSIYRIFTSAEGWFVEGVYD